MHNFSLVSLLYNELILYRINKTEDTLHKLDISRHSPICGLFPAECQSLRFPAIEVSHDDEKMTEGKTPLSLIFASS